MFFPLSPISVSPCLKMSCAENPSDPLGPTPEISTIGEMHD